MTVQFELTHDNAAADIDVFLTELDGTVRHKLDLGGPGQGETGTIVRANGADFLISIFIEPPATGVGTSDYTFTVTGQ